jgi:hypothetical protein
MKFKQLPLLIFLSGMIMGLLDANASSQVSTGFLIDLGPTPKEETLRDIAKEKSVPIIIIGAHSYLPPVECVGNRMLAGNSENRDLGGDSENRELGGDSENRDLGGDSENRDLGGDSENRDLGGDSENRELAGNSENRDLGGDSENRDLGGDSENRELAGNSENRDLGGDSENRDLGGDSENRELAGNSESRDLGGGVSNIKCHMTPAGFAVIYHNKENIIFYDGNEYFKNSVEYKF